MRDRERFEKFICVIVNLFMTLFSDILKHGCLEVAHKLTIFLEAAGDPFGLIFSFRVGIATGV